MTLPANAVLLRVYKTGGGTKRVEPPVALAHVESAPAILVFVCLTPGWNIKSIDFRDPEAKEYFHAMGSQQIEVSQTTPHRFWEYEVTLTDVRNPAIEEIVQGNSSPGVLVDD